MQLRFLPADIHGHGHLSHNSAALTENPGTGAGADVPPRQRSTGAEKGIT